MQRQETLLFPPSEPAGREGPDEESAAESPQRWRRPLGESKSCTSIRRANAAPMLPVTAPPQAPQGDTRCSTRTTMSMTSGSKSRWDPLGSKWRTSERSKSFGESCDGRGFINGCVPHWGKDSAIRMKGLLEHELTWAYYRMGKHSRHPQRHEVGDTLPKTSVCEKMRFGSSNQFKFWTDLRPPFTVLKVKRVDETGGDSSGMELGIHPGGELYTVTYECGLEYIAEHVWGDNGENATYDNKIHGDAQVRIPIGYPQKRPLQILSWGRPVLNWSPKDDEAAAAPVEQRSVPPGQWMPIANELGVQPNSQRMAACRELSRKAAIKVHSKRHVEVPELERLLLGPHASLPRLARCENAQARATPPGSAASGVSQGGHGPSGEPAEPRSKVRQHRIWTSAAGFITYAG